MTYLSGSRSDNATMETLYESDGLVIYGASVRAFEFYEFDLMVSPVPDADENVEALVGYALREVLAGESVYLVDAVEESTGRDAVLYRFSYDVTKSRRDDPDICLAFERVRQYLHEGTPVRKTNRAGEGTKGTRKFEGFGHPVSVTVTLL